MSHFLTVYNGMDSLVPVVVFTIHYDYNVRETLRHYFACEVETLKERSLVY